MLRTGISTSSSDCSTIGIARWPCSITGTLELDVEPPSPTGVITGPSVTCAVVACVVVACVVVACVVVDVAPSLLGPTGVMVAPCTKLPGSIGSTVGPSPPSISSVRSTRRPSGIVSTTRCVPSESATLPSGSGSTAAPSSVTLAEPGTV